MNKLFVILIISFSIVAISSGFSSGLLKTGEMSDRIYSIINASGVGNLVAPQSFGALHSNDDDGSHDESLVAGVGFSIAAQPVDPNPNIVGDEYFNNVIKECKFHSDESIGTETCVICKLIGTQGDDEHDDEHDGEHDDGKDSEHDDGHGSEHYADAVSISHNPGDGHDSEHDDGKDSEHDDEHDGEHDDNQVDTVLGQGRLDLPNGYTASQTLQVEITDTVAPGSNGVQDVHGVRLEICELKNGCTPGFWKNHSELGPAGPNVWPQTGYHTNDKFSSIFGKVITIKYNNHNVKDPTLYQAVNAQGGGINALARHSVAALLNAAAAISYPLTVAEVISDFQHAFDTKNYEETKNFFEELNQIGCPFGNDDHDDENNHEHDNESNHEHDDKGKSDDKGKKAEGK